MHCELTHDLVQLVALTSQVLLTLAVGKGLGKHDESLDQHQLQTVLMLMWQEQPLHVVANTIGKISIAVLLVMLHGPYLARIQSTLIWTLAGGQTAVSAIAIAFMYTQCRPAAKLWQQDLPGTCDGRIRNQTFGFLQGGEPIHLHSIVLR